MLTKGSLTSWRLLVGVLAVGVCVPAVARADDIPRTLPVERARTADYRLDTAPSIAWIEATGYVAGARLACTADTQCSDCNPCTRDDCVALVCEHTSLSGSSPIGCDNDVYCDGLETCVGTTCTPGTAVDCGAQVCDEAVPGCVDPCSGAGDCDDGLYCTDDDCVDEVCVHTPAAACGPGGTCAEPDPGPDPDCGDGRCCVGGTCTAEPYGVCAGTWLATEDACDDLPGSGTPNTCPIYGSGIAPQGEFISMVGPISGLTCDDYFEIGDDYETNDHATNAYMDLQILRFAGIVMPEANARWRISFYDEYGIFVEDVFWPDGQDDTPDVSATIKTVDFDPPIPVPTKGFVTWSVQANFGPDGRVQVVSTDAKDLGENDADRMFVDGTIIEQGETAPLADGARILVFEIVGTPVLAPLGACCIAETGLCEETLPWTCEAANNVFQGIGSSCLVCDGNRFVSCNSASDCWACDGGVRVDEKCDAAACPGGTCDAETGTCTGGDNATEPCDCPGAECVDVNGVDGCSSELLACQINACCDSTFGDCEQVIGGLCSITITTVCGNDAQCPDGETCEPECPSGSVAQGFGSTCEPNCCAQPGVTGGDNCTLITKQVITVPAVGAPPITITLTGNNSGATFDEWPTINSSSIFNPAGGTQDPGWWEGFSTDACANIRLDLCCTSNSGVVARPNWGNLWTTCGPPDNTAGQIGVDWPIGVGRGTSGYARGGPFCDEDNLWGTWGPMPAGDYYYPIYSAPESTMATASGGGDYQLHITVQACQEAACCLPEYTCVDGLEIGDACDPDIQCPDGECTYVVDAYLCVDGANDGNACDPNFECTTGECMLCAVVNELDCAEHNGYWLAGLNIPTTMEPVVVCDFDPCETGSCCTGPGECKDDVLGDPMTLDDCVTLGGDYVGNALCDYPSPPCPACAISGAGNCVLPDLNLSATDVAVYSDLSAPPNGIVTADDFIPTATTISTVCTWGAYLARDPGSDFCDTADGCDCNELVNDNFRITVYADNNGIPGAVVGQSSVTLAEPVEAAVASGFSTSMYPASQLYEYQLELDSPIVGLSPGTTYWLEIANNTECIDDPNDDTCVWHWRTTPNGANNYLAIGTADGYTEGSGRANLLSDMAFCLDQNIDPPGDVLGACCNCAASTCSYGTLAACDAGSGQGIWVRNAEDCESVTCGDLTTPPNDACENAIPIFGNNIINTDTGCSTTDPNDDDHGSLGMGRDIWYAWTVGCAGRVVVSMCGTGNADVTYDSALGVYYDVNDPTNCPCRSDPGMTSIGTNNEMDEGCNTVADGGAGIIYPLPQAAENCLMIRVAGFGGAGGRGMLEVSCEAAECFVSSQPEPERLELFGDPVSQKGRYISFSAGEEDPVNQAVRVTFTNVPAPYQDWEGVQLYVQEPQAYCENSGVSTPVPPATECPDAVGGLSQRTFWGAQLDCNPYLTDWTLYDMVHVYDEGIIPNGDYDLAVIEEGCTVLDEWETNPDLWSPVVRFTQTMWGDCVENCTTTPCSPPLGTTNTSIGDVTAVLDKWKNLPGNIKKARGDMEGSPAGDHRVPDQAINITDVTYVLGAFLGDQYPGPGFPDPSLPPVCP